jgi:hypothetical protein
MLVYDMTINGKTCHDISEIFLKLALSINQSINQSTNGKAIHMSDGINITSAFSTYQYCFRQGII